jgi:crossover junction endodeoxyribonuclease RuvC
LPSLANALLLSAALKCPVEILFFRLFKKLTNDVNERKNKHHIELTYTNSAHPKSMVAIDPGMNQLGLAAFDGTKLSDYAVKVIPIISSVHARLIALDEVVDRYLEEKKPAEIALEKTTFSSASQNGMLVLAYYKILAVARRRRLPVYEYVPISIRKSVCGNGHATKRDVMKVLISKYPELRVFAGMDRRWKERHYFNLFDAVAVGVAHLSKAQNR